MYKNCIAESITDCVVITFDEYDKNGTREYHVTLAMLDDLKTVSRYVFENQVDGFRKYNELCEKYDTLPF